MTEQDKIVQTQTAQDHLLANTMVAFFNQYSHAFASYDIAAIKHCYQLPCTLSTPEQVLLLADEQSVDKAFNDIFRQLSANKVVAFKILNSSYQQITTELYLVNIDWQFLSKPDKTEQLFTEFTAIYHLIKKEHKFTIVNVISQDISQGLKLNHELKFK